MSKFIHVLILARSLFFQSDLDVEITKPRERGQAKNPSPPVRVANKLPFIFVTRVSRHGRERNLSHETSNVR